MVEPHHRFSTWRPALALLLISTAFVAWVGLRPPETAGAPVAVMFPPWWSFARVVAAVDASRGAILRAGAWPNILVVVSTRPNMAGLLRGAGAWLVVDPGPLAGCSARPTPAVANAG